MQPRSDWTDTDAPDRPSETVADQVETTARQMDRLIARLTQLNDSLAADAGATGLDDAVLARLMARSSELKSTLHHNFEALRAARLAMVTNASF